MTHRVAIIGNGPSVLRHRWGAQIDACDEVVRINTYRCTEAGCDYRPYVGSRITAWATYLDLVGYPVPRELWWVEFGYIHLPDLRAIMEPWCAKYGVRFIWVPDEAVEAAFRELHISKGERNRPQYAGMKPSTGIVAIEYARMRWPQSELYVAGFDGFSVGDQAYYWTSDVLRGSSVRKHFPERQREYIVRLLKAGTLREFAE